MPLGENGFSLRDGLEETRRYILHLERMKESLRGLPL